MKNFGRLAALLTGAAFSVAAPAAFAQVAGFNPSGAYAPMRPGGGFRRPVPTSSTAQQTQPYGGQPTAMRPGPVFGGRPLPTGNYGSSGNYGPVVVLPEAPPARYYGSATFSQLHAGWNGSPIETVNNYRNAYGNSNGGINIPPIGPGNGFFNNLTPPIGPANGFFNNYNNAPTDSQDEQRDHHHRDYPIYTVSTLNTDNLIAGSPSLGGYYYGNYCDNGSAASAYPSVYSVYSGFPQYILSPGVSVTSLPDPVYVTPYQQFAAPNYSVTYNNNYYYVANAERAHDLEAGGDQAKAALQNAYPADSFQAAFGDIARAWTDSDIKPLRKHVRDSDTRINVSLNKKYSYSIASGDFVQITRDALDKLHTVSFVFTHIRKAKNGDVTAYGKHVYHAGVAATNGDNAQDGAIVPFDQAGSDTGTTVTNDTANSPADGGTEKTVYVSYTLHHGDTQWYIIAVDSSEQSLITDDK